MRDDRLPVRAPAPALAACALLSSAGLTWGDSLWHTTLQQRISESAISRVSAIDWTGTLVLNPLGFALVGPLAAGIGIRTTLIASALLTLGSALVVLAVPSVRNLRADDLVGQPVPAG